MTTTGYAVTAGWDVPVGDQNHVHGAVMTAETAAVRAGLRPTERAACALTATELATDLARHARGGRLVVTATDPGPCARVQLASVDDGPDVVCEVMLRDGSREDDTCLLVCELTSDRAGADDGPPAQARAEPLS